MAETDNEKTARQLKIVLVGNVSSGKTSLATRYVQEHFGRQYRQTAGVDFFLKRLEFAGGIQVSVQIWDIGGTSLRGKMLDKYIYGSNGVLLVYDIANLSSFEDLEDWYAQLKTIFSGDKMPHVSLIANKCDLEHMRTVKSERHNHFAMSHGMSSYCVSAKTGDSVSICFQRIIADILGIKLSKIDIEQEQTVIKADIVKSEHSQLHKTVQARQHRSSFCALS